MPIVGTLKFATGPLRVFNRLLVDKKSRGISMAVYREDNTVSNFLLTVMLTY